MKEDTPEAIKRFHEMAFSFAPMAVMATAAQLDLFSHLTSPKDLHTLAQETSLHPKGVHRILQALVRLGVLEREISPEEGETYRVSPSLLPLFSPQSALYIGHFLIHAWKLQERWQELPRVIASGHPLPRERDPQFPVTLARGLFAIHWFQAKELAKRLSLNQGTVLDVAGGSGVWSAGLLEEYPHLKGIVLDLPQVVEGSAKPILERMGLIDRYSFIPGDMFQEDWGYGHTAIILGHICHALARDQILFLLEKARQAVSERGKLILIDFLTDPQDLFPALFSLNMLVATQGGDVYSQNQYRLWIENSGFRVSEVIPLSGPWKSAAFIATPA